MRYSKFLFIAVCFQFAQNNISATIGEDENGFKPDYTLYNLVLQKHVNAQGEVDYAKLRTDTDFPVVLQSIALMHPSARWTRAEQQCFWINVYNMFSLKLVSTHFPVQSILDIPGAMDSTWIKIGVRNYSLNHIRNELLVKKFADPRLHFVLNNATLSPQLHAKAYTPQDLEMQLNSAMQLFVNDKRFNVLAENAAVLSPIFAWYRSDIELKESFLSFINRYSEVSIADNAEIKFAEFDWQVNAQAGVH